MQSQLNEMQSMMNQMQVQQNKMPISWHQLPLEMKEAIVIQMDAKLRGRFSMCSKLTNELVRGFKGRVRAISFISEGVKIFFEMDKRNKTCTSVFVKARDDGGSNVFLQNFRFRPPPEETYSTATDWKETVLDILGMMGRVITVDVLELIPDSGFKERFKWFRDNLLSRVKLQRVYILIIQPPTYYDESVLDWPSDVSVKFYHRSQSVPNLELFNTYEKIITFDFSDLDGRNPHVMTDEVLMKMINIRCLDCSFTRLTMTGVVWWFRKWLSQKDDNKKYQCKIMFERGNNEFSFENVKNRLSDVIEKTEQILQQMHGAPHWWKIWIKKNGKIGGIIKLRDGYFDFSSDENEILLWSKS